MKEVSDAITLSEASRLIHPGTTTNDYIRNTIVVQGTGTAYAALTALPLHCDIIGLGADVRGNGDGIARIGADTGTGYGVLSSETIRGLNIYNIQFQAGSANYCFKVTNLFRCILDNCAFATNGDPTAAPAAGVAVDKASGLIIRNSHWLSASSGGAFPDLGISVTGTHFHQCLIENNYITGVTAGIQIASGCIRGYGSLVKNNYIGWGGETCAIGVDDNVAIGHIIYAGNYLFATDAFDLAHNGAGRIVGNIMANGFVT